MLCSVCFRFGGGQLRPIMLFGHEAERLDILKNMGSMTKNTVLVTAHHVGAILFSLTLFIYVFSCSERTIR